MDRLRLCVVGDLDGIHTRSWLRFFVELGHDVHAISYYHPASPLEGVAVHTLNPARRPRTPAVAAATNAASRVPPSLLRLANAYRYWSHGLATTIREIAPDVLHAHYVVEHAFYAALAGYHPYVVSAWGSDVLVAPEESALARRIARFAIGRADLITSNNRYMASRIVALGAPPEKVEVVTLGAERFFLEGPPSVNLRLDDDSPPTILSTRSLDSPLYNIDSILYAFAIVRESLPAARLVIAGRGRLRPRLEAIAQELHLGESVRFAGFLDRDALRDEMASAHVFVSVPSSDATSVAVLQAMAAGAFPIVSDLPTQHELVDDGTNGYRVPPGDAQILAKRIVDAAQNPDLRRRAVDNNRGRVSANGLLEDNMQRMEDLYLALSGKNRFKTG